MDSPAAPSDDDAGRPPEAASPAEDALLRWPHEAPAAPAAPAPAPYDDGPPAAPTPSSAGRGASAWAGRLVAAAAGAGLVLVGLALRDSSPMRRPPRPRAHHPAWRRRLAAWLRGED